LSGNGKVNFPVRVEITDGDFGRKVAGVIVDRGVESTITLTEVNICLIACNNDVEKAISVEVRDCESSWHVFARVDHRGPERTVAIAKHNGDADGIKGDDEVKVAVAIEVAYGEAGGERRGRRPELPGWLKCAVTVSEGNIKRIGLEESVCEDDQIGLAIVVEVSDSEPPRSLRRGGDNLNRRSESSITVSQQNHST